MKTCREIIQEIVLDANAHGQRLTEKELIRRLDHLEGFWEQAFYEDFDILDFLPEEENAAQK